MGHVCSSLRTKLLPVIHGTTAEQVRRSAQAARRVGSESLGFGSFQTSGPNASVNSFTPRSLRLLVQFARLCAKWHLGAHVFGIGGPSAIPVLHYAAVKTFDSAGWIRTAAYGNVHLPYLGAVNITGATASRRYVTRREFNQLRNTTGHICPFCADEVLLVRSWRHRALHNYCTVKLLARSLKDTSASEALAKLRRFNPRFAGYLEIVLQEQARHGRNATSPEVSADF
jgi:queuine/archaeosine tRNA-ribosyltransferase